MSDKIKGILTLENESELFVDAVKENSYTPSSEEIGINLSLEWEENRVTGFLSDKKGCTIGVMTFNAIDFMTKCPNIPTMEEMEAKPQPTEEEKEEINKEFKGHIPVSRDIELMHKD